LVFFADREFCCAEPVFRAKQPFYGEYAGMRRGFGVFRGRNQVFKELYEAYPNNVSFKNGLAVSYYKLGQFYRDNQNDKKKALAYFLKAEELWVELVRAAPQYAEFQRFLAQVQRDLENL
jgi:hypothetical protein